MPSVREKFRLYFSLLTEEKITMKRALLISILSTTLGLPGQSSKADWNPIDQKFLNLTPRESPTDTEENGITSKYTFDAARTSWQAFPTLDEDFKAPYVAASKSKREVVLWGEATGMNPGEPTEFFVISSQSGHNYESITITYAMPSDVQKALEHIGLKNGWPVSPAELRFWPKGDRLMLDLHAVKDGSLQSRPIEHWVVEVNNGQIIKQQGFVFTGSRMVEDPGEPGSMVYAADIYGPNSIVSDYNEAHSVIELPRQGTKGEVYGQHIANPDLALPKGQPVMIVLKPHPTLKEVYNLDLEVSKTGYRLKEPQGEYLNEDPGMASMLTALKPLRKREPFVTIKYDPDLNIEQVKKVAAEMEQIERVGGFRIDPPPEGHLYFKAFIPDETFLDRNKRPTQPLEFHANELFAGTLTHIEEKWGDNVDPELIVSEYPVPEADAFADVIAKHARETQTLFVYLPLKITSYGDLQAFLQPHLKRFPVIYIYPSRSIP